MHGAEIPEEAKGTEELLPPGKSPRVREDRSSMDGYIRVSQLLKAGWKRCQDSPHELEAQPLVATEEHSEASRTFPLVTGTEGRMTLYPEGKVAVSQHCISSSSRVLLPAGCMALPCAAAI